MNFQSTEYKQATTSTWERASRYCPSSVFSFHTHAWDRLMKQSAAAKSLQSCPTLCDSIDGSPPGSPIPGILQARTLEWVAISFSNAWKWKVKVKSLSRVRLFTTPWTAAYQAPPTMGFSGQEYWSGVPSPSPDETASASFNNLHLVHFVSRVKTDFRSDQNRPFNSLLSVVDPKLSFCIFSCMFSVVFLFIPPFDHLLHGRSSILLTLSESI